MSKLEGRIAIYARYSSDRQQETSIDDQVHRCREFIGRGGGEVREGLVFEDRAISGAVRLRPGLNALMAKVDAHAVDVVVVEDLSRLSRDTEDAANFRKRFTAAGVRFIAIADGIDTASNGTALIYAVRSAMAESYRADLADKTRRGLRGRARDNKVTGALPYGYRSEPAPDGKGKVATVDPATAPVVQRIFRRYAEGVSQAGIAGELNSDGVPTSGKKSPTWQNTAVRAILKNEKYVGRWVFNKTKKVLDPKTRKPRYRPRPESEWIVDSRPELQIVDEEIWAIVQARFASHKSPSARCKRDYLLSGAMVCGVCGAPCHTHGPKDRRYYRCSHAAKRDTCDQRSGVREKKAREAVLHAVRLRFASQSAQEELRRIAAEEIRAATSGATDRRKLIQQAIAKLETKAERLMDALEEAEGSVSTLVKRLEKLEADKTALIAEREQLSTGPKVVPSAVAVAQRATDLNAMFDRDPKAAQQALRACLSGPLKLFKTDEAFEIHGTLDSGLLLQATTPASGEGDGRCTLMVAGARCAQWVKARSP